MVHTGNQANISKCKDFIFCFPGERVEILNQASRSQLFYSGTPPNPRDHHDSPAGNHISYRVFGGEVLPSQHFAQLLFEAFLRKTFDLLFSTTSTTFIYDSYLKQSRGFGFFSGFYNNTPDLKIFIIFWRWK